MNRRASLAAYLMAAILAADQLSKWWIVNMVMRPPHTGSRSIDFLNFVLVWNKGVTFGLLNEFAQQYMPWILIGVAFLILILLSRWLWRTSSTLVALSLGAVMGGAIGNIIDRLRYGAVVDFLDFHYRTYHWYAFNIADAAIVTGVSLLVVDSLVRGR